MSEEKPDNEVEAQEFPEELKADLLSATLPSYKYFIDPFAVGGDLQPIPDTPPPGGQVNYTTGFGSNYSLNYLTDPSALAVPRKGMNQLFNDITTVLQEYQQWGTPVFITSSQNGGVPFPYSKNAYALYDPGTGPEVYQSLADGNTALPTDATMWIPISGGGDAVIADIQSLAYTFAVAGGTANAITVNPTPAYNPVVSPGASLVNFRASNANTGATTINVSGNGAVNLLKQNVGAGQIALTGGEIQSGVDYSAFINSGSALLINPSPLPTDAVTPLQLRNQSYIAYLDTGSVNAITVFSPSPDYLSLVFATQIQVLIAASNTGPTTIAINSISPVPVVKKTAAGGTEALSGGELIAGTIAYFVYNGTNMELQNPLAYGMQYGEMQPTTTQTVPPFTTSGINLLNIVFSSPIIPPNVGTPSSFQPNVPGRYRFSFNILFTTSAGASSQELYLILQKNLSNYRVFSSPITPAGVVCSLGGSVEENCNGTSDYFSLAFANNIPVGSTATICYSDGSTPIGSNFFQCTYLGAQ